MQHQNEFLNGGQKSQPADGRDRNGFTVIDLLVVIGTIAMLSVLLLPAWAIESRSQTSNFRCANNLKQLGLCLTMYSDAYSDHYPAALSGSTWIWPTLLRPFMGQGTNTAIYNCPEGAANGFQWVVQFGSGSPAQYGYLANERRLDYQNPSSPMSYGYNMYGACQTAPYTFMGLGFSYGNETKKSQVVKPSAMIAIGDSNTDVNQGGTTNFSPSIGGWQGVWNQTIWPLDVHGKRVNLVFCDGHVQAMKRTEIIPDLAAPADRDKTVRMWNYDNGYHYP